MIVNRRKASHSPPRIPAWSRRIGSTCKSGCLQCVLTIADCEKGGACFRAKCESAAILGYFGTRWWVRMVDDWSRILPESHFRFSLAGTIWSHDPLVKILALFRVTGAKTCDTPPKHRWNHVHEEIWSRSQDCYSGVGGMYCVLIQQTCCFTLPRKLTLRMRTV